MSDTDKLCVEIIICYDNKTWDTRVIKITEDMWLSKDSDKVSHYCYNNPAIMLDGIQFIGVYSWMD